MWLERHRVDQLGAILPRLYEPHGLDEFPRHVVGLMPELLDYDVGAFNSVNVFRKTGSAWIDPPPESRGIRRFSERFGPSMRDHPLAVHHARTGDTRALRLSDFVSRRELLRLEAYHQLLHPLAIEYLLAIAHLTSHSGDSIALGLSRSHRDFSDSDRAALELLRPHFVQAWQNADALTRADLAGHRMLQALEAESDIAMVLMRGGVAEHASPRAIAWMREFFPEHPFSGTSRMPAPLAEWINHHTARLGRRTEVARPLSPYVRNGDGARLIVRLMPTGRPAGWMLLLARHWAGQSPAILEQRLGLPRREAAVLFWIAMGKTSAEAAAILGVSRRTVEKHLERLYQKFGVESRVGAAHVAWEAMRKNSAARANSH